MKHLPLMIAALLLSSLAARSLQTSDGQAAPAGQPSQSAPSARIVSPYSRSSQLGAQASRYYNLVWGIESPSVKAIESGELIRFSYYVLDPVKAKPLNDRRLQPFLLDASAGIKLVIPQLEKVGMLRQTSPPEAGRSYWMAFSNKGGVIRKGDHVDVVIGTFKADGLVVE